MQEVDLIGIESHPREAPGKQGRGGGFHQPAVGPEEKGDPGHAAHRVAEIYPDIDAEIAHGHESCGEERGQPDFRPAPAGQLAGDEPDEEIGHPDPQVEEGAEVSRPQVPAADRRGQEGARAGHQGEIMQVPPQEKDDDVKEDDDRDEPEGIIDGGEEERRPEAVQADDVQPDVGRGPVIGEEHGVAPEEEGEGGPVGRIYPQKAALEELAGGEPGAVQGQRESAQDDEDVDPDLAMRPVGHPQGPAGVVGDDEQQREPLQPIDLGQAHSRGGTPGRAGSSSLSCSEGPYCARIFVPSKSKRNRTSCRPFSRMAWRTRCLSPA